MLVVYDLVESIIEASHLTNYYLIIDTHTSHMSMFNECFVHLCDYTLLNVMYMLNHLLIKSKKISKCFSCFLKEFCFEKFHKNPKICNFAFWRLTRK